MAIISNDEFRNRTYKRDQFDEILFQSYGKRIDKSSRTSSRVLNNIERIVNTINSSGSESRDFFLQDLYISSKFSAIGDWATELRIKILEPYSIDTFLTNLLEGLARKGYYNFDRTCNFVVKIDFVGYADDSEEPELIPFTTRYYPVVINKMTANLTEQGTVYEISATPINETGMLDDANVIPGMFEITGNTVEETLKSLENTLNEIQVEGEKNSNYKLDRYQIQFEDDKNNIVTSGSDKSIVTSEIASYKMFDLDNDTGSRTFLSNKQTYLTGNSTPQENNAELTKMVFKINGKHGILKIIDNIITDSYFVIDKIRNEFQGHYDEDGQVKWWRIITSVKNREWDASRNTFARDITFKIIPRKVHYTKLTSLFVPGHVSTASDYDKMCARNYEWQYSGNNRDILSFNITFNHLWKKIVTANMGKQAGYAGEQKPTRTEVPADPKASPNKPLTSPLGQSGSVVIINPKSGQPNSAGQIRSGSEGNPLFSMARDMNALINNPYEMIQFNMEILGDPMWLGTQYMDDTAIDGNKSKLFTVDGGIALRTVDPIVRVIAYAPEDFNEDGFLAPMQGQTKPVSKISAYYTVTQVESFFQDGVFKQKLGGFRQGQQDLQNAANLSSSLDIFGFRSGSNFNIRR
jgi:hypothetical protein